MTTRRRPTSPERRPSRAWHEAWPSLLLLLGLLLVPVRPALADPEYSGPILYGIDPVLRTTRDPRLLGIERLVLRERLLAQGVDPLKDPRRPDVSTMIYANMKRRVGVDLERESEVTEASGITGLYTTIRYPDWLLLFQTQKTLPGGFSYYPTRPVDDPAVELFVDDVALALTREWAATGRLSRLGALDIAGGGRRANQDQNLINFTIPIKLPRTLEMIIGRGEKTRIKITGREHIAIRGETTRSNQFTPSERVQSQSWFPDLDMEQQLQVNLTGQIGEKIFIEVDHNSEAIGPEGTKIKLSYQGDEDEIIQSIETGDVGLTLPGGRLLGYSSNQSGLFGIKVTGQVGPADFTVVASKKKAESDSKTFSSTGGEVTEHEIYSWNYLNNRFFRLDLPNYTNHEILGYFYPDIPGRNTNQQKIDTGSIRIYRNLGGVQPMEGDVQYVAAALDTTGVWNQAHIDAIPVDSWNSAWTWRPVEFTLLNDVNGDLVAVDLRTEMTDDTILAVTYDVIDADRNLIYRVGEDPNNNADRGLELDGQGYYRMKLLKPEQPERFSFQYVLRNIYSLGGANINAESFELRIETTEPVTQPALHDTTGILYLQAFGLDSENPQGVPTPDGVVDAHIPELIDLGAGLLKFPLDFPFPFAAEEAVYRDYAQNAIDAGGEGVEWEWAGTRLEKDRTPEIYDYRIRPADYDEYATFKLVARHAAASSTLNLGVSNIEEGSEQVVLDGRTLQSGVDYDIDYLFGTVSLKGQAAADLTPDSNVQVTYQYAPFFGGGQSSLLGFNLGYDLGPESKLNTTWLYESNSIVGHKAKLGEEPSRNLVGNLNLNHTVKTDLLTGVANVLARGHRDKESTLALNGEAAVSIPNPNTRDQVFLEDFEGAASTDLITLGRLGWYQASRPVATDDERTFDYEDRIDDIRWHVPTTRVLRKWLNPDLINEERNETQQAIDLNLRQDTGWNPDSWGGIMRGISRTGLDLSKSQFIEIWINDSKQLSEERRGRLHIDFGTISEDFIWENVRGDFETGTWQLEDLNTDGVFNVATEDVGLDAVVEGQDVIQEGVPYSANQTEAGVPGEYPYINRTAKNNYEDSEDLDGNTRFDQQNGYFSAIIDLRDTEPLVDVYNDYPEARSDLEGTAWRKYRIRLSDVLEVSETAVADIAAIRHVRIWYEDPDGGAPTSKRIQLSELQFLGSRWERQGIRKIGDERVLDGPDLGPDEGFFIGEVNNKENSNIYVPPFPVHEQNNIPEKESSLVLDFTNLQPDHLIRIGKQVSAQGDDYTRYNALTWWWHCPSADVADLDMFYRLGADSLNYYEVSLRFAETDQRVGWQRVGLDLVDLTNVKTLEPDADGIIRGTVRDREDGTSYRVTVRGNPDLRRVTRYYFGVANQTRRSISGDIWINDVMLLGAKRDIGLAESVGLRLNMADVFKLDFDWDRRDAEFHGLDADAGQGYLSQNWSLSTNFRVDDFVPLLGFQLPVSFSRRQSTQRPKYEINSDIEILDQDRRNELSTLEERESFSVRLSRPPSRSAIPRYLIDPWNAQLSGSQSDRQSPTEESAQSSLQGSLNYNLQITGEHTLGGVPLLGAVPVLGSLSYLPRRIEGAASFTATNRESQRKDLDGTAYPPTVTETRPGTLTGGLEYRPLQIVTAAFNNRSERDLLREQKFGGINIGEENKYSQDMSLTFTVPRLKSMPQGKFYAPLRTVVRGLDDLKPSLTYQGSYVNDHNPSIRQPGDPADVRSISNSNEWQFRAQLPLGGMFKSIFPERKRSEAEKTRMIEEQQRLMQQARGQAEEQFDPAVIDGWNEMTLDQREEAKQRWLLEQAELRLEEEQAGQQPADGGGGIKPGDLLNPFLSVLRGFDPISFNYTDRRTSGYGRITGYNPDWRYKLGFITELDVADTSYAIRRNDKSQNISVSTKTRLTREVQIDIKYALTESQNLQSENITNNYTQDWPDLRLNIAGLERWRLFGGKPDDRDAGWFRSSSIDVAYKHSKNVPGYTETYYAPRMTTTITPRWNFNFHSGMTLALNGSWSDENSLNNGTRTLGKRMQLGLQLQHEISAQKFLAKLGLYRPGNQPTVNMAIDLRYAKNTSKREVPGAAFDPPPTGTRQISLAPRFSYNITRNLSGAFSLNFSQNKNIATDLTTTTIGLGLEATFVF